MDDGSAALCPKSNGTGSVKKYGEYGYLYLLSSGIQTAEYQLPPVVKKPERSDSELDRLWRPRAEQWRDDGRNEIGRLATKLGVSVAALRELGAGWDGKAWTFPEKNEAGLIVGVSRRFEDGGKRFARGGRRGLTYSDRWNNGSGPVLIVEGQSDTAAGITLGISTIGRPSNVGGLKMLIPLLRDVDDRKLIVIGERDRKPDGRWPGMDGCKSIANGLAKELQRNVEAKLLPAKDLRSWLNEQNIDVYSKLECHGARLRLLKCL